MATLTYVYADSTAVLGPLAVHPEPHCYDLCAEHAERLTVPRGWEVVRLRIDSSQPPPSHDDLLALAEAVRAAGRPQVDPSAALPGPLTPAHDVTRRGHLRVLRQAMTDD